MGVKGAPNPRPTPIARPGSNCSHAGLTFIPAGAEPVGRPPMSFRFCLGKPATVGELRKILEEYPDEEMLMLRNGPLPTFYLHVLRGNKFIEFD